MVKLYGYGLLALSVLTRLASAVPAPEENAAAVPVRIMPFGASIVGAPGCWRAMLWKKLQDHNIKNTDFVGSRPKPPENCGAEYANYDGENEGHAGALATDYVANNNLPPWLEAAKPDVIVMHLGTNDVLKQKSTEDIIKAYGVLVDQMRASKKSIRIIISHLIPLSPKKFSQDAADRIKAFNQALPSFAAKKSTATSPIVLVDNYAGFNIDTDTDDGEHPNAKGNMKLADKFYGPVADAVLSVSAKNVLRRMWGEMGVDPDKV
jgi:lysophospholipase L1-like esterase